MNVALPSAFDYISLCAGGGGLDLGLRLAFPNARAVCYVEREATAAALLVAHMQAGDLDDAPLWSDLRTFDGRSWRGLVDAVIGGIPCQPWSVAGKRRGADDERNLWPDTIRVIQEIGPRIVFIENVGGIVRDGYHGLIKPDLERAGYRVTAGIFTAAEVGAPHRRERLFILAYARGSERIRRGDREREHHLRDVAERQTSQDRQERHIRIDRAKSDSHELGDPDEQGLQGWQRSLGERGDELPAWPPGPAERDRWAAILAERPDLAPAIADVADAPIRNGHVRNLYGRGDSEGARTLPEPGDGSATGYAELSTTPAESEVRLLADGLATGLVRRDQLSILGNGVVPAQAALAFRTLWQRLEAQGQEATRCVVVSFGVGTADIA